METWGGSGRKWKMWIVTRLYYIKSLKFFILYTHIYTHIYLYVYTHTHFIHFSSLWQNTQGNQLKRGWFILAHGFKGLSLLLPSSTVLGPVMRKYILMECHEKSKATHFVQPGSREGWCKENIVPNCVAPSTWSSLLSFITSQEHIKLWISLSSWFIHS